MAKGKRYSDRTEELIAEAQGKLGNVSREEVLAKVPSIHVIAANFNMEKPLGGFLKRLSKAAEAGNNSSSQEIFAGQIQEDFDKHPEYKGIVNKLLASGLLAKISQALGISSDPKDLGYDPETGSFDASKAAAAALGAKIPEPEGVQTLIEEVKATVAVGESAPEASDAAASGTQG